jgi:hypothetical protein
MKALKGLCVDEKQSSLVCESDYCSHCMNTKLLTPLSMNPITHSLSRTSCIGFAVASLAFASSTQAAVIFTVTDTTPANFSPSTELGTVSNIGALDMFLYEVELDLTSVGGTATETIAFDVEFTQTGGTGIQFNGGNNISVTGGTFDTQIEKGETLTATLTLNTTNTTFNASNLTYFFTEIKVGGYDDETWDLVHDGGTINMTSHTQTGLSSSFLTIQNIDRPANQTEAINLNRYSIEITATGVPEPSSTALLGLAGLALILRRRR